MNAVMTRFLTVCLTTSMMVALCACGLFMPREAEPPGHLVVDPLNFAEILENSHSDERFGELDYERLFHEDLTYLGLDERETFGKDDVVGRLKTIVRTHGDVVVTWALTDTSDHETAQPPRSEIYTLQSRSYRIIDTTLVRTGTGEIDTIFNIDCSGEASFKLLYDNDAGHWTIYYWRDIPSGDADKSFFHPNFPP